MAYRHFENCKKTLINRNCTHYQLCSNSDITQFGKNYFQIRLSGNMISNYLYFYNLFVMSSSIQLLTKKISTSSHFRLRLCLGYLLWHQARDPVNLGNHVKHDVVLARRLTARLLQSRQAVLNLVRVALVRYELKPDRAKPANDQTCPKPDERLMSSKPRPCSCSVVERECRSTPLRLQRS